MGGENTEYGADQIQILEGLEAVRKRPGMYKMCIRDRIICFHMIQGQEHIAMIAIRIMHIMILIVVGIRKRIL